MDTVKCLVVDDEPLARELVESHLAKLDQFEHTASCNNALAAFSILNSQDIDLMFLDIQMPMITGLDFIRNLKSPPKVIITSAFRHYAIDGFDLDVVDYLLKPITFERFLKAIEKYLQLARPVKVIERVPEKPALDFVYLRSNKKHHKVDVAEILYIESNKDYITVHMTGRELVVKQPISEVEGMLDEKRFLRIHRSYLVNVDKITAFTASDIEINAVELPIGTNYKKVIAAALNIKE
ncbi:LytR/AlgR family response regulator transcription factor [Parachryseolinea silvisoli]|uniref:LytR/AlgR family response regulator transcription factor n=1 Tax=Parachryseolinea silvisoli TaxID=2873601 RepID=UPI002265E6BC|nr:LytTR family DNA-binding domain-containing protein [Parachryseolinea silvisoli]MCD9015077.1 LytTR family DNA-binding domain-containing protein [Parachryseolinea silvisoli]